MIINRLQFLLESGSKRYLYNESYQKLLTYIPIEDRTVKYCRTGFLSRVDGNLVISLFEFINQIIIFRLLIKVQ